MRRVRVLDPRSAPVSRRSGSAAVQRSEDATPPHADWIIKSHVAFYEADGKTPRAAPQGSLRLWVPYVVGDIYGAPNAGELAPVALQPDLTFTLNLNRRAIATRQCAGAHRVLAEVDEHRAQGRARVARVSPFVLPADGIVPGRHERVVRHRHRHRLMLIYLDRPARIRGEIVYEGRNLRFDIEAKEAGYLWVQPAAKTAGSTACRAQPAHLSAGGNAQAPDRRGIFRPADPSIS